MSKIASAEKNLKQAHEALKTSLFKWKPDESVAAMFFKKAAEDYKAARKLKESNECLDSAIENFKKANEWYSAGKAFETKAMNIKMETESGVTVAQKTFSIEALKNYESSLANAAICFNQNGSVDSTFHILNKGSSTIDNQISRLAFSTKTPDLNLIEAMTLAAVNLSKISYEALLNTQKVERSQDIASNMSTMSKILLRYYNLSKKEEILMKILKLLLERNHHHCVSSLENNIAPGKLGTYATEIIMLHLENDDFIAAKRYWDAVNNPNLSNNIHTQITGVKSIEEANILTEAVQNNHGYGVMVNLMKYWDDDNGDKCQETLKSHYFKNLETEFVKMIQNLKNVPTGMGSAPEQLKESENLHQMPSMPTGESEFDFNAIPGEEEEEDDDDLL